MGDVAAGGAVLGVVVLWASDSEAVLALGLSRGPDKAGLGSSLGAGEGRTGCPGLLEESTESAGCVPARGAVT